jgi:hypothetical protein
MDRQIRPATTRGAQSPETATRKQTAIVMNQKQSLLYVTVISTTPEKLWEALTNPDFIVRYWFGRRNESTWKVGAPIDRRDPGVWRRSQGDMSKSLGANWYGVGEGRSPSSREMISTPLLTPAPG